MKRFALLASLAVALLLLPQQASAQIGIAIEPSKTTFVAYEPINVTVTINNRAGRDVVLRGAGERPWLSFQVNDGNGNMIGGYRAAPKFEPVLIGAGQTLRRTIAVNNYYPMTQQGMYTLKATVYFPPLDQLFSSEVKKLQVSDGAEIMRQVVGVPDGLPGAGSYRRFSMLTFNSGSDKTLYLRVQNETTGAVLSTFPLGQIITVRQPEWTFDKENRLHILHMGAPKAFAHTVVDATGQIVARDVYREHNGTRPSLINPGTGDVIVQGGISDVEEKQGVLSADIHPLSERPPGLPEGKEKGAGLLR